MLNVLEITYRADTGGGPQHMLDLLSLNETSSEVQLFSSSPRGRYEREFKEKSHKHFQLRRGVFYLFDLIGLLIFCRSNDISIIHSHGRGAGLYSRILGLFGMKVIHTLHGVHFVDSLSGKLKVFLDKFLLKLTDLIILVSEDEKILAEKLDILGNNYVVIHNGIDLNKFKDVLNFNLTNGDPKKIAVIARSNYQKGIDLLIDFVDKNSSELTDRNITFSIAGDGPLLSEFKADVNKKKLDNIVHFCGDISDIKSFLKGKGALVSFARWEGLPLSVIEGLASGLPCYLSNVSGHQSFRLFSDSVLFFNLHFNDLMNLLSAEYIDKVSDKDLITLHKFFSREAMTYKIQQTYRAFNNA